MAAARVINRWWSREDLVLILLLSALFFLPGLGQVSLFDRDEPRFSTATREMMDGGDWAVPHFNGDLRSDKPPLLYWVMMTSYTLVGQNELGARLPSAVFSTLTLLVVYWIAGSRFGRVTGIVAAVMLGSCSLFIAEARLATADATMIFFTVLTLGCAWRAWDAAGTHQDVPTILPRPKFLIDHPEPVEYVNTGVRRGPVPLWVAVAFWIALSLGTLTKGVPLAFVFVPMITLSVATGQWTELWREWRKLSPGAKIYHAPSYFFRAVWLGNWSWWRQLKPMMGLPILILLVGSWVLIAGIRSDWMLINQMVGVHFLVRTMGPLLTSLGIHIADVARPGGNDPMSAYRHPPGFYLALVWITFWPWTPLIIPTAYHTIRRMLRRTAMNIDPRPYQFLVAWIVPMWILLELSRGKLVHYCLPLYVAMIILCADTVVQSWFRLTEVLAARWFNWARYFWLLAWLGMGAATISVVTYWLKDPNLLRPAIMLAGAFAAVGIAGTIAWRKPAWIFITALGYGGSLLIGNTLLVPQIRGLRATQLAMGEAIKLRERGFQLIAIGHEEPTMVFYSGQILRFAPSPAGLSSAASAPLHHDSATQPAEPYSRTLWNGAPKKIVASHPQPDDTNVATVAVVNTEVLQKINNTGLKCWIVDSFPLLPQPGKSEKRLYVITNTEPWEEREVNKTER